MENFSNASRFLNEIEKNLGQVKQNLKINWNNNYLFQLNSIFYKNKLILFYNILKYNWNVNKIKKLKYFNKILFLLAKFFLISFEIIFYF